MLDGVLDLIPTAKISVVGLQPRRGNAETRFLLREIRGQHGRTSCPDYRPDAGDGRFDGCHPIDLLKAKGCKNIKALVLVAAPEGVESGQRRIPAWLPALDSP